MTRRLSRISSRPDHKFREGDFVHEKDSDDEKYYEVICLDYKGFRGNWEYTFYDVTYDPLREDQEHLYPPLNREDKYELAPICPNCDEYHPHDVSDEYDDESKHYRCETESCDVDVFKVEPGKKITYSDGRDDDSNGGDSDTWDAIAKGLGIDLGRFDDESERAGGSE